MDAALKKSGLTLVVIGLCLAPIAPLIGGLVESPAIRHMASLATTFSAIAVTFGCIRIARAKGQPWYVGLLGLLSVVGFLIVWFAVPDKSAS